MRIFPHHTRFEKKPVYRIDGRIVERVEFEQFQGHRMLFTGNTYTRYTDDGFEALSTKPYQIPS
jgi:hypothetical protein